METLTEEVHGSLIPHSEPNHSPLVEMFMTMDALGVALGRGTAFWIREKVSKGGIFTEEVYNFFN